METKQKEYLVKIIRFASMLLLLVLMPPLAVFLFDSMGPILGLPCLFVSICAIIYYQWKSNSTDDKFDDTALLQKKPETLIKQWTKND